MSDTAIATTVAFSESNFNKGTVVHADAPAAPAPSVSVVVPVANGKVEGRDLDTFRPGLLATDLDRTGDILRGRDIAPNDTIEITSPSGQPWRVPVRIAESEGWVHRDAQCRYHESDRQAQVDAFNQMRQLEASKREAEAFKHKPEVEDAVRQIADALTADGMDFMMIWSEYLGSDGARVNPVASAWFAAHGLDAMEQMRTYTNVLRGAVTAEVLLPQGIDPETFLKYLELNRSAAIRAALYAHTFRSLDGFKALARAYLDTGGRARRARR